MLLSAFSSSLALTPSTAEEISVIASCSAARASSKSFTVTRCLMAVSASPTRVVRLDTPVYRVFRLPSSSVTVVCSAFWDRDVSTFPTFVVNSAWAVSVFVTRPSRAVTVLLSAFSSSSVKASSTALSRLIWSARISAKVLGFPSSPITAYTPISALAFSPISANNWDAAYPSLFFKSQRT